MNFLKRILSLSAVVGLLVAPITAYADIGAPVTQTASRLDATSFVAVPLSPGTGGAQAVPLVTPGVNQQYTTFINPPAGMRVYITEICFDVTNDGTGAAVGVQEFTSTGLASSPGTTSAANPSWGFSNIAGAGQWEHWCETPATPLTSAQPGVQVTIVTPAASTHEAFQDRVYGYFAP